MKSQDESETEPSRLKEHLGEGRDPWESLAFQFCKIATFALIFQKYTFFAATVLAGLTYWYVFLRGVKTTRCVLKKPLIVAIFWTLIAPIAAYFTFR